MITKSRIYSIVFYLILGVVAIGLISFLVISNWRVNQKREELKTRAEELQKEIQFLEERKKHLEAGVIEVSQEEYLEEKIREQGYEKPGEQAIVIKKEQEEEEKKPENEPGFWENFFNIFKRD